MRTSKQNTDKIKRLTAVAMFCALAYVCMLVIKIPVSFLTLDIKDSMIILCSLLFGPISGVTLAILVPLLELITLGGETGVYGFLMNILSSLSFAAVTGLIYRWKRSLFGAIAALLSGVFAMTAVMMLANLLITPHYLGVTAKDVAVLIPTLLLPFNLIKAILNAAIALLLYKPLSLTLKKIGFLGGAQNGGNTSVSSHNQRLRSIFVTISAVLLIALSLTVVFLVLRPN